MRVAAGIACCILSTPLSAAEVVSISSAQGGVREDVRSTTDAPPFDPTVSSSSSYGGASAWSSADLTSGTMRGGASNLGSFNGATFNTALGEVFDFTIAGATADTITTVLLNISFEAEVVGSGGVSLDTEIRSTGSDAGLIHNLSSIRLVNAATPIFETFLRDASNSTGANSQLAYSYTQGGALRGVFSHDLAFDIKGQTGVAGFYSQASGSANFFADVNFGNSAHFSFKLPENVLMTSRSGVAFGPAVAAVPEPATWAMLIVGFGAIGGSVRAQRRKSVVAAVA